MVAAPLYRLPLWSKNFFSLLYSFVDRMKLRRQAGNLRNTAMTGIFVSFVRKSLIWEGKTFTENWVSKKAFLFWFWKWLKNFFLGINLFVLQNRKLKLSKFCENSPNFNLKSENRFEKIKLTIVWISFCEVSRTLISNRC